MNKKSYDLMRRKIDKELKVAPAIKAEMGKQMPRFKTIVENFKAEDRGKYVTPDKVM